jgi:aryl-alcohol dehydrogenase-like predicted oxidoreductase
MVGVSNYSVDQMRQARDALARRGVTLASNQVHYSLLHRQPESSGLLDECHRLDVTLIAYSPLGQGRLTGKYTPVNPPPGLRGRRYGKESLARLQPLLELMRGIGETHGDRSPAQVALNWVISKGAVPIPGVKNARQAQDVVGAMDWSLTEADVAALDAAAQEVGD